MPSFSESSLSKLQTAHPDLQKLFSEVIKTYDCTVLEGFRCKDQQEDDFNHGKSKLHWPEGKHNSTPSEAVDVAPWPIDWNAKSRFYHFAGFVQATAERLGIKIRFGGDWNENYNFEDDKFKDLVHFELER